METNVAVWRMIPGFDDEYIINSIIHAKRLKAIVLELYGTGNMSGRKQSMIDALAAAVSKGIIIVAVSQCLRGTVDLRAYALGQKLEAIGVISGADMTTEAVCTKLAYLLSWPGMTCEKVKQYMGRSLRGEVTENTSTRHTLDKFVRSRAENGEVFITMDSISKAAAASRSGLPMRDPGTGATPLTAITAIPVAPQALEDLEAAPPVNAYAQQQREEPINVIAATSASAPVAVSSAISSSAIASPVLSHVQQQHQPQQQQQQPRGTTLVDQHSDGGAATGHTPHRLHSSISATSLASSAVTTGTAVSSTAASQPFALGRHQQLQAQQLQTQRDCRDHENDDGGSGGSGGAGAAGLAGGLGFTTSQSLSPTSSSSASALRGHHFGTPSDPAAAYRPGYYNTTPGSGGAYQNIVATSTSAGFASGGSSLSGHDRHALMAEQYLNGNLGPVSVASPMVNSGSDRSDGGGSRSGGMQSSAVSAARPHQSQAASNDGPASASSTSSSGAPAAATQPASASASGLGAALSSIGSSSLGLASPGMNRHMQNALSSSFAAVHASLLDTMRSPSGKR